ncbi:hypothetical protein AB3G45_03570 [Shinella sp. S4-D37]|uniref:hypothetical protein n=1 Tax=Shinella sp. S4-D37 TaxID=3161999 RepID=UPI0034669FE8
MLVCQLDPNAKPGAEALQRCQVVRGKANLHPANTDMNEITIAMTTIQSRMLNPGEDSAAPPIAAPAKITPTVTLLVALQPFS